MPLPLPARAGVSQVGDLVVRAGDPEKPWLCDPGLGEVTKTNREGEKDGFVRVRWDNAGAGAGGGGGGSGGRLKVGERVKLVADFERHGDASGGPLKSTEDFGVLEQVCRPW